jgi:hypothetical protein
MAEKDLLATKNRIVALQHFLVKHFEPLRIQISCIFAMLGEPHGYCFAGYAVPRGK